MLGYTEGQTVIVTTDGHYCNKDSNQVGVIVKKFKAQNKILYDVLLESRSAISALISSSNNQIYINRELTRRLCDSEIIKTTVPYAQLIEDDMMPHTRC